MNKVIGGIVGVVVLVIGVFGFSFFDSEDVDSVDSIMVASFNGEIFGDSKLANVGVDYYVDLVSDYDLFFLLEIRDIDNSSFEELCGALVGYECYLSARSGRTISKESVGVFIRDDFSSVGLDSHVGDTVQSVFERIPASIDVLGIKYWVVHLAPDDVYREMEALEILVGNGTGGVIVLGDMNADCDYYSSGVDFDSWNWVIDDDADTATGFRNCAYDRIIASENVSVIDSGVVEIDPMISDHNLVWAEIGK